MSQALRVALYLVQYVAVLSVIRIPSLGPKRAFIPNTDKSPLLTEVGKTHCGSGIDLLPSLISFLQFRKTVKDIPLDPTSLSLDASPSMILEEFGE